MKNYFKGYYFKYQNNNNTIAFIIGNSDSGKFTQVITDNNSYYFDGWGNCKFSKNGAIIDIGDIKGHIRYSELTPLKYDIMGIFKYFPMECRHIIVSMRHKLSGWVSINGIVIDFTNGIGYIEGDSGISFPKSYLWAQCNFNENCSVSLSIADIPFMGFGFKGCICAIYYKEKEYRLATYLGVKILYCNSRKVVLKQGKYLLVVNIFPSKGQILSAPRNGKMDRIITECLTCPVRIKFYKHDNLIFDLSSVQGSFEMS